MRARQLNTEPGRFVLTHRHSGNASGAPTVVLLHDRYGDLDGLDAVARPLEPDHPVIAVRAARTQIRDQFVHGYYWYIDHGACEPEASTLGDALAQIELGLFEHEPGTGGAGYVLVGKGQGATVALLVARAWPELVRCVVAWDGCIPAAWASGVDVTRQAMDGVKVLLVLSDDAAAERATQARAELEAAGAEVQLRQAHFRVDEGDASTSYSIARWVRDACGQS